MGGAIERLVTRLASFQTQRRQVRSSTSPTYQVVVDVVGYNMSQLISKAISTEILNITFATY